MSGIARRVVIVTPADVSTIDPVAQRAHALAQRSPYTADRLCEAVRMAEARRRSLGLPEISRHIWATLLDPVTQLACTSGASLYIALFAVASALDDR